MYLPSVDIVDNEEISSLDVFGCFTT